MREEREGKREKEKERSCEGISLNIVTGLRAPLGLPDPNIAMGRPAKRPTG